MTADPASVTDSLSAGLCCRCTPDVGNGFGFDLRSIRCFEFDMKIYHLMRGSNSKNALKFVAFDRQFAPLQQKLRGEPSRNPDFDTMRIEAGVRFFAKDLFMRAFLQLLTTQALRCFRMGRRRACFDFRPLVFRERTEGYAVRIRAGFCFQKTFRADVCFPGQGGTIEPIQVCADRLRALAARHARTRPRLMKVGRSFLPNRRKKPPVQPGAGKNVGERRLR